MPSRTGIHNKQQRAQEPRASPHRHWQPQGLRGPHSTHTAHLGPGRHGTRAALTPSTRQDTHAPTSPPSALRASLSLPLATTTCRPCIVATCVCRLQWWRRGHHDHQPPPWPSSQLPACVRARAESSTRACPRNCHPDLGWQTRVCADLCLRECASVGPPCRSSWAQLPACCRPRVPVLARETPAPWPPLPARHLTHAVPSQVPLRASPPRPPGLCPCT